VGGGEGGYTSTYRWASPFSPFINVSLPFVTLSTHRKPTNFCLLDEQIGNGFRENGPGFRFPFDVSISMSLCLGLHIFRFLQKENGTYRKQTSAYFMQA
jgi:hypothetical protein